MIDGVDTNNDFIRLLCPAITKKRLSQLSEYYGQCEQHGVLGVIIKPKIIILKILTLNNFYMYLLGFMFGNLKLFKIKIKFQFKDKTQDFLKIKPMKRTDYGNNDILMVSLIFVVLVFLC